MTTLIAMISSGKIKLEAFESITNQTVKGSRVMLLMEDSMQLDADPLVNKIENITRARNQIRSMALATDCSHVWWVDSDVVPERNALELMLAARRNVVCGWFPGGCGTGTWPMGWIEGGIYRYADKPIDGVAEIGFGGFGCVLTSVEALRSIPFRFSRKTVKTTLGDRLESEATAWISDASNAGFKPIALGSVICKHILTQ